MSYTIIVFVKQVPDTKNVTGDAMKPDGTVNRQALPAIFNPEDLNALEMALNLKDRYGARVIAATMGPPAAAEVLRNALYRGADEAILLTDRAFAGADTLATSFALSRCAKKIGNFDLIMCGRQAIDGDTAQVGPQIAEKLALPQISYVEEIIDLNGAAVKAKRAIEGGYEVLQSPLPALLTVIDANEPRPQNASRIMKFKKAVTKSEYMAKAGAGADAKKIEDDLKALDRKDLLIHEWSAAEVVPPEEMNRLGLAGSPTKVKQIMNVVLTAGSFKEVPATEEGIKGLVHELVEDHTLG